MRTTTRLGALALASLLASVSGAQGDAGPKEFEIAAAKYEFTPKVIEVTQGDKVVFKMHSTDVEHGLQIKALKVKVLIPKGGEVVTTEFVASVVGTFPFSCSEYCGSGHSRMKGQLVVHPAGQ